MAPKYKLIYFNARGRGELIRILFAAADVKYEDKRIEFKDWPDLKAKVPQGTLPVLVIDGKVTVSQSLAIARYLARELKLYGKDKLEGLYVDQLVDTAADFMQQGATAFFEKDEERKEQLMATFKTETVPKFLNVLEKTVGTFGKSGFSVGNMFSLADFMLFTALDFVKCGEELEKYPLLVAVKKKVEGHPQLSKYLKTRPDAAF